MDLSILRGKEVFSILLKIDNPWLAGAVSIGAAAVSIGALSLGAFYVSRKYPTEDTTRRALERTDNSGVVDPEVMNITDGHSILVELHCHTETSFLLFLEDFEKKTVKFRLEEEFKKIGFEHKLEVTIQNAEEVYKKARQIRERSTAPKKVEETAISEHSHLLHGKAAGGGESTVEAQDVTVSETVLGQLTTSFTKKEKEKEKESKEAEQQPNEKKGTESEEQPSSQKQSKVDSSVVQQRVSLTDPSVPKGSLTGEIEEDTALASSSKSASSSQDYLERISKLEKENVELRRKMEAIEQGFEGRGKTGLCQIIINGQCSENLFKEEREVRSVFQDLADWDMIFDVVKEVCSPENEIESVIKSVAGRVSRDYSSLVCFILSDVTESGKILNFAGQSLSGVSELMAMFSLSEMSSLPKILQIPKIFIIQGHQKLTGLETEVPPVDHKSVTVQLLEKDCLCLFVPYRKGYISTLLSTIKSHGSTHDILYILLEAKKSFYKEHNIFIPDPVHTFSRKVYLSHK